MKTDLKNVSEQPNAKFTVSPFLDLVVLDDLDFKYAHRKIRMVGT